MFLVALQPALLGRLAAAATRTEPFDTPPVTWEGVNNRSTNFPVRTVKQDFGYNPSGRRIEEKAGEAGGSVTPAGEAAYYGYRPPKPLSLDTKLSASGKILVVPGPNHFLLGFFNATALNEWRTPNTLVVRVNGRGEGFHCHLEFCSSRWRSDAGVIGEIVPGKSIAAKMLPAGKVYAWRLEYDPNGGDDGGLVTLTLGSETATCKISKEHRADGCSFTHFGLLPVLKAWDDPGVVWINDVTVNGKHLNFASDPGWDGFNNRRTYQTTNTRPRFDFGWSPTHYAGGKSAGEIGGLIFRGDCRDRRRMAAYGDKLSMLTLNSALYATGKVCMLRGVSDSTASIGFYHSEFSLSQNPSQDHSTPNDFLGVNIEGPSSEGFFFYPVYRAHGDLGNAFNYRASNGLCIYPDGKSHTWALRYDPSAGEGRGRITLSLDERSCELFLEPGAKKMGTSFDRFGICTPWIDGNSVTAYFDDLEYTFAPN